MGASNGLVGAPRRYSVPEVSMPRRNTAPPATVEGLGVRRARFFPRFRRWLDDGPSRSGRFVHGFLGVTGRRRPRSMAGSGAAGTDARVCVSRATPLLLAAQSSRRRSYRPTRRTPPGYSSIAELIFKVGFSLSHSRVRTKPRRLPRGPYPGVRDGGRGGRLQLPRHLPVSSPLHVSVYVYVRGPSHMSCCSDPCMVHVPCTRRGSL